MAKAVKFNNDNYLDASSIKYKRRTLNDMLNELYYEPGDNLSVTDTIQISAFVTTNITAVAMTIVTPKRLDNIETITCNSFRAEIRGTKGYLLTVGGMLEYANDSNYVIECIKTSNNTIRVILRRPAGWPNADNNTPVMINFGEPTKFTFN